MQAMTFEDLYQSPVRAAFARAADHSRARRIISLRQKRRERTMWAAMQAAAESYSIPREDLAVYAAV